MGVTRQDKLLDLSRYHLQHELDLVNLLQQLRFFNAALTELLPTQKLLELRNHTRKLDVSDASALQQVGANPYGDIDDPRNSYRSSL